MTGAESNYALGETRWDIGDELYRNCMQLLVSVLPFLDDFLQVTFNHRKGKEAKEVQKGQKQRVIVTKTE